MAQSGYTPVLLYGSTTTGNIPSAANLTTSASGVELAINAFDGKLFYKDSGGVVQVLATKGTGTIGGSNTQVQYNSSGALAGSANLTFDGTTLVAANFADSSLTSGRVTYATTSGNLTDSANLTFDGTSLTLGGNPTLSAGTANGVTYLNGSKVLTSGSGLVFDGTNLGLGVTPSAWTTANSMKVVDVAAAGTFGSDNAATFMTRNGYYNGTNWIYKTSAAANHFASTGNSFAWFTAPSGTAGNAITFTQAMTLDASGNLLVGTTTAREQLTVNAAGYFAGDFNNANAANGLYISGNSGGVSQIRGYNTSGGILAFYTNAAASSGAERARIDSSGNLLVGTTSGVGKLRVVQDVGGAGNPAAVVREVSGDPYGLNIGYGGTPNGPDNYFIVAVDNTAARFYVKSNGGIANYQGNDTNLSDRREKTNFAPAGSYLDKICAIPVQTFNYIDQNHETDTGLTLGVVAQDVEAVAPELVTESNWGTEEEPKMRLSVYQTDLQYALMKCIQELKAELDAVKAQLAAQ